MWSSGVGGSPAIHWLEAGLEGLDTYHPGLVSGYVDHYNNVRLNSATGYITPKDMLAGAAAGHPCGARPKVGCGPENLNIMHRLE